MLAKAKTKPGLQGLKRSSIDYRVSVPGIVPWRCLSSFSRCSSHTTKCAAGVAAEVRGAVLAVGSGLWAVPFSNAPFGAGCAPSLAPWHPSSSSSGHLNYLEGHTPGRLAPAPWVRARAENLGYRGGSNGEREVGSSPEGLLLSAREVWFGFTTRVRITLYLQLAFV